MSRGTVTERAPEPDEEGHPTSSRLPIRPAGIAQDSNGILGLLLAQRMHLPLPAEVLPL